MTLYDDPRAAAQPPTPPRGPARCEVLAGRDDLAALIGGEPDALARALSVSVFRLGPDQLRRVAALVVKELSA